MEQKPFVLEKKIYYHDTDCGGVVYYANYLKHLEEGRTEFCSSRGVDIRALAQEGTYFVVARIEVDYKSSARYQDTIKIATRVEQIRRSSLVFVQEISRDGKTLIEARVVWVCVNNEFKPQALPEIIRRLS